VIATNRTARSIANITPFADDFVCSPLQTVPKQGSSTRRVVMDLSFPQGSSVNDGIPPDTYLGDQFKLRLSGLDRLVEFILAKGRNCLVFKKDLRRACRQFPVDPRDYSLLGFCFQGRFYFDTHCPFGLRSSAMICQRTTKAVVHIFTGQGFSADVYLDDFYGAEYPSLAFQAFSQLGQLFQQLGLDSSPEKDTPPSTRMICLGILVDTEAFTLEVPASRLEDLRVELNLWRKSWFVYIIVDPTLSHEKGIFLATFGLMRFPKVKLSICQLDLNVLLLLM